MWFENKCIPGEDLYQVYLDMIELKLLTAALMSDALCPSITLTPLYPWVYSKQTSSSNVSSDHVLRQKCYLF